MRGRWGRYGHHWHHYASDPCYDYGFTYDGAYTILPSRGVTT